MCVSVGAEDARCFEQIQAEIGRSLPSECSLLPMLRESDKFLPLARCRVDLATRVTLPDGRKGGVCDLQGKTPVQVQLQLTGIRRRPDTCDFAVELYATEVVVLGADDGVSTQCVDGFQRAADVNLYGATRGVQSHAR